MNLISLIAFYWFLVDSVQVARTNQTLMLHYHSIETKRVFKPQKTSMYLRTYIYVIVEAIYQDPSPTDLKSQA